MSLIDSKGAFMKVYAFVGSSGSGKSYRAMTVASSRDIEYIIDDGLLIKGSKKLAGSSAKREKTKVGAVKRALFNDLEHRRQVSEMIAVEKPESILILGTSDEMVRRIASNLGLKEIDETVYIEDVSTATEIQTAKNQRMQFGKHVIPVPTVELKQDFSGYFMDRLSILLRRRGKGPQMAEKTVMRPTFSYLGNYTIANRTLVQIISHVARNTPGVAKVMRISIIKYAYGIEIDIDLALVLEVKIVQVCEAVQKNVKEQLELMTNLHVIKINIHVRSSISNN